METGSLKVIVENWKIVKLIFDEKVVTTNNYCQSSSEQSRDGAKDLRKNLSALNYESV